jgi:hypothetical protein
LFARSRHGSTTSTRSRNSTGRRIDLADGLRTGVYVSYSMNGFRSCRHSLSDRQVLPRTTHASGVFSVGPLTISRLASVIARQDAASNRS